MPGRHALTKHGVDPWLGRYPAVGYQTFHGASDFPCTVSRERDFKLHGSMQWVAFQKCQSAWKQILCVSSDYCLISFDDV